jgi:2-oxoacid dehydrogenases acyltransferase (catalytic domain)
MMNRRRRFGDRYDGRLIRSMDPINKLVPFIMKTRIESQITFEDKIDIDSIDEYIKNKRQDEIKNLSFLHIVIASAVRTMTEKPGLNRFVAGQRIYARNEILFSFVVKKHLNEDSPETTIKIKFLPEDTLIDIVSKVNKEVSAIKASDTDNDAEQLSKLFNFLPGFLIRFVLWLLISLDYFGMMPKAINKISPFHSSLFLTDLGSLGVDSINHHLYNLGTNSIFLAFGKKITEKTFDENNNIIKKKYVSFKVTADERIADGYYFAVALKTFKRLMQNPAKLEQAPEKIVEDWN